MGVRPARVRPRDRARVAALARGGDARPDRPGSGLRPVALDPDPGGAGAVGREPASALPGAARAGGGAGSRLPDARADDRHRHHHALAAGRLRGGREGLVAPARPRGDRGAPDRIPAAGTADLPGDAPRGAARVGGRDARAGAGGRPPELPAHDRGGGAPRTRLADEGQRDARARRGRAPHADLGAGARTTARVPVRRVRARRVAADGVERLAGARAVLQRQLRARDVGGRAGTAASTCGRRRRRRRGGRRTPSATA